MNCVRLIRDILFYGMPQIILTGLKSLKVHEQEKLCKVFYQCIQVTGSKEVEDYRRLGIIALSFSTSLHFAFYYYKIGLKNFIFIFFSQNWNLKTHCF